MVFWIPGMLWTTLNGTWGGLVPIAMLIFAGLKTQVAGVERRMEGIEKKLGGVEGRIEGGLEKVWDYLKNVIQKELTRVGLNVGHLAEREITAALCKPRAPFRSVSGPLALGHPKAWVRATYIAVKGRAPDDLAMEDGVKALYNCLADAGNVRNFVRWVGRTLLLYLDELKQDISPTVRPLAQTLAKLPENCLWIFLAAGHLFWLERGLRSEGLEAMARNVSPAAAVMQQTLQRVTKVLLRPPEVAPASTPETPGKVFRIGGQFSDTPEADIPNSSEETPTPPQGAPRRDSSVGPLFWLDFEVEELDALLRSRSNFDPEPIITPLLSSLQLGDAAANPEKKLGLDWGLELDGVGTLKQGPPGIINVIEAKTTDGLATHGKKQLERARKLCALAAKLILGVNAKVHLWLCILRFTGDFSFEKLEGMVPKGDALFHAVHVGNGTDLTVLPSLSTQRSSGDEGSPDEEAEEPDAEGEESIEEVGEESGEEEAEESGEEEAEEP